MPQFYTVLTEVGQAKLANALALGTTIDITDLAVGDGGGAMPQPDSNRETLVNEVRRAPVNTVATDPDNPSWLIVEQVLPPEVGGWTIREVGLIDVDGDLIGYGNFPETYKPTLAEGSGRTQTIRMVLEVTHTTAVTLRVDPSVVLATREYVDTQRAEHEQDAEAHADSQITLSSVIPQAPDATKVSEALAALGEFAADGFQNIAVFDAAGTTSWVVPEVLKAGRRKALVTVIGAGGGGGNHTETGGGGGSGGGVAHKLVDLTGVDSVDVTVGAGGVGAPASTSNTNGGQGGSSSFGAYCSATGGYGANNWCPGDCGEGVGGDINTSLGPGSPGAYARNITMKGSPGSGGGPGARSQGSGNDGVRGADATLPGGGGAGGTTRGGGGNGAPGEVIVRW